jgi:hypothetical protein
MRARIELTPEQVADVLREYVEARGCTYVDHEIMPDNSVHIVAELDLQKPAAAPVAKSGVRGAVQQELPGTARDSSVYPRKLREDEKRPDDPYDDGDMEKPYVPVPRSHPKEVDDAFADEFAKVLEENQKILDAEKAKRN